MPEAEGYTTFDKAKIKHILIEYYMGVGKTIFLSTRGRTLFKMESAYGSAWDKDIADEVYDEIVSMIQKGEI